MLTSDLIQATRRHVDGAERGLLVQLTTDLPASSAPTILPASGPVQYITPGSYASAGLETFYVIDVTTGGQINILRGQDGTSPAAHQDGDLIRVNPTFTDSAILGALNDEILSLSAEGLYRVATLTRTFNPTASGYDLASDMLGADLLEIRWQSTATGTVYWPEITDYEVAVGMPTDVFPSGTALFLYQKGEPNQRFQIRYKAPMRTLINLTDDVVVNTGLPVSACDIPPLGAAIRLQAGRAIQRADFDWQGEPRRANESPVSEVLRATSVLQQLRARRVQAEVAKLSALTPVRLVRR